MRTQLRERYRQVGSEAAGGKKRLITRRRGIFARDDEEERLALPLRVSGRTAAEGLHINLRGED